jgi:hypothetical protein
MRKHSRARSRLGTSTIKETVNAALRIAAEGRPGGDEIKAAMDVLSSIDFVDREHAWR